MNVKAEIVITVTDDGRIQLRGPIADKITCIAALEMAKHVVLTFDPNAADRPGILLARGGLPVNGAK